MVAITQLITLYTGDTPIKGEQTNDEFMENSDDWVDYFEGNPTEMNTFSDQANSLRLEVNLARSTTLASANYAGVWEDLTGALTVPSSVNHLLDGDSNPRYWMLTIDEISTKEYTPGIDPEWIEITVPTDKGLTLLSVAIASNDESIEFNSTYINTVYDEYELHCDKLIPATDDRDLYVRTSSNDGSSFDDGATDYDWRLDRIGTSSTQSAASKIIVADSVGSDANEYGFTGKIILYSPSDETTYTTVSWNGLMVNNSAVLETTSGGGRRLETANVNAIRLLFAGGDIESGTVRLYGVKKS